MGASTGGGLYVFLFINDLEFSISIKTFTILLPSTVQFCCLQSIVVDSERLRVPVAASAEEVSELALEEALERQRQHLPRVEVLAALVEALLELLTLVEVQISQF